MRIEDIRFNFLGDGKTSIKYIKGGTQCEVLSFNEIKQKQNELKLGSYNKSLSKDKNNEIKEHQPAIQIFTDGVRSVKNGDEYNFACWNNVICIDIDTKKYKGNKIIKWDELEKALHEQLKTIYYSTYICLQRSYSNTSWHVFFGYACGFNRVSFDKMSRYAVHCIRTIFYNLNLDDVIDYPEVIDSCMDRPTQPIFISGNPFLFNDYGFDGKYNEQEIKAIADISENNEVVRSNDINIVRSNLTAIDVNNISCFSKDFVFNHNVLWRIVNICTCVFDDYNEFYEWICWFIDNLNCNLDPGRTKEFYKKKNYIKSLWDSLSKSNTQINMSLMNLLCRDFGWSFRYDVPVLPNDNKYVYQKDFERNYKKHVHNIIINKYISEIWKESEEFTQYKEKFGDDKTAIEEKTKQLTHSTTIENKLFDNVSKISYWRMRSCKKIFDWNKDKYICGINKFDANDSVTYKMFADLYYRDKEGNPTIRYNVVDDDIEVYNMDKQEGYVRWHKFRYSDEQNVWTSESVFSTKCRKELMWSSIDEYVPDYHRYDPIRDYLNHFEFTIPTNDEIEQIETFFIRHLQAQDTPLNRAITRNWIVAAVKKRLYEHDFVFPHILMLQGDTNNNKSFSICKLFTIYGKDYFVQDLNTTDSDAKLGPLLQSNWCIMFGERKGISKIDNNANKEFVDRINTSLKFQKKFKNEVTVVNPKVVCVITTNDNKLFNDYNVDSDKRFWLIECNAPAYSSTRENRKLISDEIDDIWRIAVNIYRQNNDIDLEFDGDLIAQMKETQKKYRTIDDEEVYENLNEMLTRKYKLQFCNNKTYFNNIEDFTSQLTNKENNAFDVANLNCLPVRFLNKWCSMNGYDSRHKTIIEKILISKGWEKKNIRFFNDQIKCWFNPNIVQNTAFGQASLLLN